MGLHGSSASNRGRGSLGDAPPLKGRRLPRRRLGVACRPQRRSWLLGGSRAGHPSAKGCCRCCRGGLPKRWRRCAAKAPTAAAKGTAGGRGLRCRLAKGRAPKGAAACRCLPKGCAAKARAAGLVVPQHGLGGAHRSKGTPKAAGGCWLPKPPCSCRWLHASRGRLPKPPGC
jgi:hypothetical protein